MGTGGLQPLSPSWRHRTMNGSSILSWAQAHLGISTGLGCDEWPRGCLQVSRMP